MKHLIEFLLCLILAVLLWTASGCRTINANCANLTRTTHQKHLK